MQAYLLLPFYQSDLFSNQMYKITLFKYLIPLSPI